MSNENKFVMGVFGVIAIVTFLSILMFAQIIYGEITQHKIYVAIGVSAIIFLYMSIDIIAEWIVDNYWTGD